MRRIEMKKTLGFALCLLACVTVSGDAVFDAITAETWLLSEVRADDNAVAAKIDRKALADTQGAFRASDAFSLKVITEPNGAAPTGTASGAGTVSGNGDAVAARFVGRAFPNRFVLPISVRGTENGRVNIAGGGMAASTRMGAAPAETAPAGVATLAAPLPGGPALPVDEGDFLAMLSKAVSLELAEGSLILATTDKNGKEATLVFVPQNVGTVD
jgi:heat shock protein HslJ